MPDLPPPHGALPVLSVSALNGAVREIIEGNFPFLRVEGEISNFSHPASGHWYFSLKDSRAQVRCAMFRNRNALVRLRPRDGMRVQVLAQPTLYEGRGEFQLVVESLADLGVGDLHAQFQAIREKLAREGLFSEDIKRPLPRWPRRVAVVTSASGAALHDIRITLRRRWPLLEVTVYPVPVQGDQAAGQICTAIARAGARKREDILLLARGGGSLEDLWCFNDERIARAIRSSPLPVVTGIGHETDFTIADFAADLRAATPTAAAEAISPDQKEYFLQTTMLRRRLRQAVERRLREETQTLDHLRSRLRHPGETLNLGELLLAMRRQTLRREMERRLQDAGDHLRQAEWQLLRLDPRIQYGRLESRLEKQQDRLVHAIRRLMDQYQRYLEPLQAALCMADPTAVLQRGYAIVRDAEGRILMDASRVAVGTEIRATLYRGVLTGQITGIEKNAEPKL